MFPNMSRALWGLGTPIQFSIIQKDVEDFEVKETSLDVIDLVAVMSPLPQRRLILKPEGQRQWNWWTIQTEKKLELDWMLQDTAGKKYRIMSMSDWSQAGFYEYELMESPDKMEAPEQ